MHSWAQLHRQSLFGICASKSGSHWMNLSSCWPTTVWLQLLLCPYQLIVACCNLFSCNGAVVLCVCWNVTIIVVMTVIVIVKWHWHLDAINGQQHSLLRWGSRWVFALVWQGRHKSAVAQGLYRRSSARSDFSTRVDCCDDLGHKHGFHLVALWAFKIGGNQCQHNLSH